jgi:hypothetical protein
MKYCIADTGEAPCWNLAVQGLQPRPVAACIHRPGYRSRVGGLVRSPHAQRRRLPEMGLSRRGFASDGDTFIDG